MTAWKVALASCRYRRIFSGRQTGLGRGSHSELRRGPATPVYSLRPTCGPLKQTLSSEGLWAQHR